MQRHQTRTRVAASGAVILVALVIALFAMPGSDAQSTTVIINEVQPRNASTIADGDGDFEDWIELRNVTNADIDIAGWRIDDATGSWNIPTGRPLDTTIPADGFLLIWASDKGLLGEPGFPGPAGELHASFKLSRTAERIELVNGLTTVDVLEYGPADVPAGFAQDQSFGLNDQGQAVVFSPVDVTPLAANSAVTPPTPTPTAVPGGSGVYINEYMQANSTTIADGDGDFEDWIELFNPTCETFDLTGWAVRDSAESWDVPAGTVIGPGEVLFLWASNKGDPDNVDEFPGPAGELHTSFRLAQAGESVFLIDDGGRLVDTVNLGPSGDDQSWARNGGLIWTSLTGDSVTPDGLNPDQAALVCVPTPTPTPIPTPSGPTATPTPAPVATPTPEECAARSGLPSIVINEAQSRNTFTIRDGDGDFSGWVELYNPTDATIDVSGWTLRSNGDNVYVDTSYRWQLPEQVTIASGEYLLIWASGKGRPDDADFPGPEGELHAAEFFLIGRRNGSLLLRDADNCWIDRLSLPALENDESYGLTSADTFSGGRFDVGWATPGAPNGPQRATPEECASRAAVPNIVINEAQSRNTFTLADGDGDFSDWIELFNPTDATIDISGWRVRDTTNQWQLPFLDPTTGTRIPGQVTIASGEYVLIWASGKGLPEDPDFPGPEGEFHTQYRLNGAEGELLSVTDFDRCVMVELDLPPLENDESYGLTDDGTPGSFDRRYATPIEPNGPQGLTPQECAARAAAQGIVINEAQSRNTVTIADGDGDFSDWLELFNPTDATVDLSGWVVKDTANEWQFPFEIDPATGTPIPGQVTIASGEYLLIWASGKASPDDSDFPGPDGEIHTQFGLSGGEGELLSLEDFDGCVIDELTLPPLENNESYGRTPDGKLGVFNRAYPTPLGPNGDQELPRRPTCFAPESAVRLNRVVARNNGLLLDADGDDSDFIELLNTGIVDVDLSLWQISDESDRSILPDGTVVRAGQTLILWASGKGDVLDADYPGPVGEIHLTFRLAGGGEQLTFAEPSECIVEQFTYPDLRPNHAYGYDAQGQRTIIVPVPNAPACAALGSIQIKAISAKNDAGRADEDGDFGDWLELHNTTDQTIDLSGWILADDSNTWVVPDGVTVATATDLLVWSDEKDRGGPDAPMHTSFKLSAGGETVSVSSAVGCVIDVVTYPEVEDDQIYRRGADGTFTLEGQAPAATDDNDEDEGAASDISIVGTCIAINEVMAKNDTTLEDDEGEFGDWIELANLSAETIDLSGYVIADWKDSWVLPEGVEIEAGGFLIVWADEGDRGEAGEELHTNFKLGSDGELVTLVDADGETVASMSSYPALDDDESFGVNDEGDYVIFEAGDASPGEGPTRQGCDFEIRVANASAAADDAEDATNGDPTSTSQANSTSAEDDAATSPISTDSASTDLATTGTSTHVQSLLAQLLIVSGVLLVTMARIARRRSGT